MTIAITALYSTINALFNVALAANVSRKRAATKIFLGTGDNADLLLAARRHGNNAEYIALALFLMLLVEVGGGAHWALHAIGATFTLGRVFHVVGVGPEVSPLRGIGALITWVAIAGAAIYSAALNINVGM